MIYTRSPRPRRDGSMSRMYRAGSRGSPQATSNRPQAEFLTCHDFGNVGHNGEISTVNDLAPDRRYDNLRFPQATSHRPQAFLRDLAAVARCAKIR